MSGPRAVLPYRRAWPRLVAVLVALGAVVAVVLVSTALAGRSHPGRPRAALSAAPGASSAPTSEAGPPAAPPGWRTLWTDDFTETVLDARRWFVYSGAPSEGRGAWWLPRHVQQGGGVLELTGAGEPSRAGQLVTGGLNSSAGQSYAYGRYLVRMRVDPASAMAYAVLLVSPSAHGGSYVVVASDSGGDRRVVRAGLRTRSLSGAPFEVDRSTRTDLTRWHTVGVEWAPGVLRFSLDGRSWSSIRSALVPTTPLALALQSQAVCAHPVNGSCLAGGARARMQVDWVSVQTRAGGG